MHIAIIGGGLAGLATAWYLLQDPSIKITLFDPAGIGGGASGIAAGLLHPYAGLHSKLNEEGKIAFAEALHLLGIAKEETKSPLMENSGLLRLATTTDSLHHFKTAASLYSDVDWLTESECQRQVPNCAKAPGILIKSGYTVYIENYLESLWNACQKKGAKLERKAINNLTEVDGFDQVVLTLGAATTRLTKEWKLTITPVKGQLLELKWPEKVPPLKLPLSSSVYIVMRENNQSCLVGATYEHDFENESPNEKVAVASLLPKALDLLPFLKDAPLLSVKAGIRASTPSRKAWLKPLSPRLWVFAGLGSKGLLYHALLGKRLAGLIKLSPIV